MVMPLDSGPREPISLAMLSSLSSPIVEGLFSYHVSQSSVDVYENERAGF